MIYKQLPNIKQYNRNGDKIDPFCGNFEMPVFSEVAYSGDYYDLSNIPDITSSDNSINITYPFSNDSDVNSFDLTLNTSMVELIDFTNFHNYYIREVTDWTSEHSANLKHHIVHCELADEDLTIVDMSQSHSATTGVDRVFYYERNTTAASIVYIPLIAILGTDFTCSLNVSIQFGNTGEKFNTKCILLGDNPPDFTWCFCKNIPFNLVGQIDDRTPNGQLYEFIEIPEWFIGRIEISIYKIKPRVLGTIFTLTNNSNTPTVTEFIGSGTYELYPFTSLSSYSDSGIVRTFSTIVATSNDKYGVLDADFFIDDLSVLEKQSNNTIPDWIINDLYVHEVALRNRINEIILRNTQLNFDNYYTKPEVYTKTEIDQKLAGNVKREIVSELPQTGVDGTIYMVPSATAATGDVYDEYMWLSTQPDVQAHFEKIGTTKADLANYYTKSEVDTALGNKQASITITNNTTDPTDNDTIIMQDNGVSDTTTFLRRKLSYLWNWIKAKCNNVYIAWGDFNMTYYENLLAMSYKLFDLQFDDYLYGAMDRFFVTANVVDSNEQTIEAISSSDLNKIFAPSTSALAPSTLTSGNSLVITIDPKEGQASLFNGNGYVYLVFTYRRFPTGNCTLQITDVNNVTKDFNFEVLSHRGVNSETGRVARLGWDTTLKQIKIKIEGGLNSYNNTPSLLQFILVSFRNSGKGKITKHNVKQDLYGDVEAPKFIKRGGTSQQVLLANGTTINMPSAPGTNKDTLLKNLISGLMVPDTPVSDTMEIITSSAGSNGFNTSNYVNNAYKRPMSAMWTYIKGKADSIYVSTAASQGLTNTEKSNAKANIGLDNVDNTSDATKKTNFTGSIASSNTGFVTGGDVYTALNSRYKYITIDDNNYTDANLFNDVRPGDIIRLDVISLTNGVIDIQRCTHCFVILDSISDVFKLRYVNYNMRVIGNLRRDVGYFFTYINDTNIYILSSITEENALRFDDTKIKAYTAGGTSSRNYQEVYRIITFNTSDPIAKLAIDITNEQDLLVLNDVTMDRALYSFGDTSYPSDNTKCSTFNGFFPHEVIRHTNSSGWEDLFVGCGFSLDDNYIINPSRKLYNLKKAFYYAYSYNSHITNVDLTIALGVGSTASTADLTSCFESADGFNVILDGVDLTNNTCTDMFKDAKNITISAIGCNQDTIDKINANISGSYTSTITVITTDPNA